jgi:hypothetical protein
MFTGLIGRTVTINGRGDASWRGRLVSVHRRFIRIDRFEVATADGRLQPAEGVARIPVADVAWIIEEA